MIKVEPELLGACKTTTLPVRLQCGQSDDGDRQTVGFKDSTLQLRQDAIMSPADL
jgi:hypothetical protein